MVKKKFSKPFVILLILFVVVLLALLAPYFSKVFKSPKSKEIVSNENKFVAMAAERAKEYNKKSTGLSTNAEIKMACEAVLNLDYKVCQNNIVTESIKEICKLFTVSNMIAVHECEGFDEKKAEYGFDVPIDEEICKKIGSDSCSSLEKEKEDVCTVILNMDVEGCNEIFKSEYPNPEKECIYAMNLFKAFSQDDLSTKEKEALCEKSLAVHSGIFQENGLKICKGVVNKNCTMYLGGPQVTQNQMDYAWLDVSINNQYEEGCNNIHSEELKQKCIDGIKKIKEWHS